MNIIGWVGCTEQVRDVSLSHMESGLRMFEWLQTGRWNLPSSTILCAVNSLARVAVQRRQHAGHLYLGSAAGEDGTFPASDDDASASLDLSLPALEAAPCLGFVSRDDGSCCIGVDPLGIFPLYYYSTTEFLFFSSSLWPFRQHPRISTGLDLDGLIGIFLTQGIVGGRTLLRGVTRLSAGHALSWRPGQLAAEHELNRVRPTADLLGATFDDQFAAVDAALNASTRRRGGDMMLLSGGLDSRLLAGYLSADRGADVEAVSLGTSEQYDSAFAQQVAGRLGWRHRSIAVDMSLFSRHAAMQARHEQLSGSFWDLAFWQVADNLHQRDPTLVTGLCGNSVLEPLRHDPLQKTFSFERVFASCNKYGFAPDTLRALLRAPNVDERIAAVIERLRFEYESFECEPFQKVQMFDLSHRARFLVGTVVWRLSFGARPIVPYIDRDVLKACLSLPMSAFRSRTLQKALLCRQFPALARLPLDTASFFTRPLLPTLGDRARHLMLVVSQGLLSRRERRYYHSVFDLNGPGWRAVRADAERSRSTAEAVLDRATLLRLLPPPDTDLQPGATNFFQVGSRQKTLLAFLLAAPEQI